MSCQNRDMLSTCLNVSRVLLYEDHPPGSACIFNPSSLLPVSENRLLKGLCAEKIERAMDDRVVYKVRVKGCYKLIL